MSEAVTSPAAQNDEVLGADKNGLESRSDNQSAGTMLKEAREARGLHIAVRPSCLIRGRATMRHFVLTAIELALQYGPKCLGQRCSQYLYCSWVL